MLEIAFVGRSNVGKSSLINHLTNNKKLARVSSSPGKTQLINFFSIDNAFCLVDLPGYGFAKVAQKVREKWGQLIEKYLESRENLKLILLLVDLRHPPTKDDIAFAQWADHYNRPLLIVFTKADKLKQGERTKNEKASFALLSEAIGGKPMPYISYSINESKPRIGLQKLIETHLE